MNFSFEPYVRYMAKTAYLLNETVVSRDCRIIYILSGEGTIETSECTYPLTKDTLLYYPYGLPYKFSSAKGMLFYTLNFDFNCDNMHIEVMTPDYVSKFNSDSCIKSIPENCGNFYKKIECIHNAMFVKEYLDIIYDEALNKYEGYSQIQSSCLRSILIKLFRNQNVNGSLSPVIMEIKDAVKDNPALNNKQLAESLGYHPYYLNEIFKDKEGITLHQYIIHKRLSKAYELITSTSLSIAEITTQCGFCSQSYFSVAFKKQFGISPLTLRKQI